MHCNLAHFCFLQSVITIWRAHKFECRSDLVPLNVGSYVNRSSGKKQHLLTSFLKCKTTVSAVTETNNNQNQHNQYMNWCLDESLKHVVSAMIIGIGQ